MTHYLATIRHHSISRAREIEINGTLAEAKKTAAKEFGSEQRDYQIAIYADDYELADPYVVSTRSAGGRKWHDAA